MVIEAQHGMVGLMNHSPLDVSYIADTVIMIRYFETCGTMRRAISVLKKRGGAHEKSIVEDQIVVELKAVRRLEDIHFVIVRSYLKAVCREHALLLNFACPTLELEIKRVTARAPGDGCSVPGFLGSRV